MSMIINNVVTRKLCDWLEEVIGVDAWIENKTPDRVIGDTKAREGPYLFRWIVFRIKHVVHMYLHMFLRDDNDVPHDHPSDSISFVFDPMQEAYWPDANDLSACIINTVPRGSIVLRSAGYTHRIVGVTGRKLKPRTLFIFGPKRREWGFVCPKGWRHWKDFTAFDKDGDSSQVGRGCGED